MPKKQINIVNLSDVQPTEETPEIQPPENDERTQIKQAIEMDEQQQPPENKPKPKRKTPTKKTTVEKQPEPPEPIEPPTEITQQDTKPKRKTRTKKTQVETPPETLAPVEKILDSPKESTPKQKPEKKIKTVELYKCDKCNKEMTAYSLRYTHPKYCSGREINRDEMPVKRQNKQPTIINNIVEITPDIIENHLRKVRETKLQQRQEKINKLVSKIA